MILHVVGLCSGFIRVSRTAEGLAYRELHFKSVSIMTTCDNNDSQQGCTNSGRHVVRINTFRMLVPKYLWVLSVELASRHVSGI